MDELDETILAALIDGKPRSLYQLLEKMDLFHNTLMLHLDNLVDQALVTRQKILRKCSGRPSFTYSIRPRAVVWSWGHCLRSMLVWLLSRSAGWNRCADSRRVVTARRSGWGVKPEIAPKSINGDKDHLKPISKQASARDQQKADDLPTVWQTSW